MDIDTIICGDCLEVMRQMPDECVDLVVTDPPYGIAFMGKEWDKALPSVDVWRECLWVLKPGGFAFVMCIPRQDCLSRMIVNLEDAGFDVSFTSLYHCFAQGFPKSANLSKLADKRLGAEREVIGKHKGTGSSFNKVKGFGVNTTKSGEATNQWNITAPATPEAKALDGAYAGYQPKPSLEVVLVVMKPLTEKTYLDQALANGKGCTWLDAGRIPIEDGEDLRRTQGKNPDVPTPIASNDGYVSEDSVNSGRFAPNLLVSDDVLNDGRVTKSSGGSGEASMGALGKNVLGKYALDRQSAGIGGYGDSGSFSRYFSLDAWAEKNLPESVRRTFPFMIVPKASKSEKNAGLDGLEEKQMYKCDGSGQSLEIFGTTDGGRLPRKNNHPTVKPIALMSYLIAIGSRPGDVVLDPYAGTCTTGIAAAIQDRHYICIEQGQEWCDIGEKRIAWHVKERGKAEQAQLKLF